LILLDLRQCGDVGLRRRELATRRRHAEPVSALSIGTCLEYLVLGREARPAAVAVATPRPRASAPEHSRSRLTESPLAMHDRFTSAGHHEDTPEGRSGVARRKTFTTSLHPLPPPSSFTTPSESPRSPPGRGGLLGVLGEDVGRAFVAEGRALSPAQKMRVISSLWRFDVLAGIWIAAASARPYSWAARTTKASHQKGTPHGSANDRSRHVHRVWHMRGQLPEQLLGPG
jgi:hypothetical protein